MIPSGSAKFWFRVDERVQAPDGPAAASFKALVGNALDAGGILNITRISGVSSLDSSHCSMWRHAGWRCRPKAPAQRPVAEARPGLADGNGIAGDRTVAE
jgi:hypothetical protein